MSYSLKKDDTASCYTVMMQGNGYQLYRVLAYHIATKQPVITEVVHMHEYADRALAQLKRNRMEKELSTLLKYGFTHYEDIY